MTVTIEALKPNFVGTASGVDLRAPLSDEDFRALRAALDTFGVLILPGQNITDAQQIAFSRRFGDLEQPGSASNITPRDQRRLGDAEVADLSNLDKDGQLLAADARQRMFNLGNRLWHSDSSFRAIPAQYSLLSARIVPASGGDTQFADMRAAYDALPESTKNEIDDLVCEHSLIYSRATLGFEALSEAERESFKPVLQRLVRRHPSTGRKSLYLSAHIGTIVGWPVPEARALIRDLTEDATHERFVYTHRWRQYDLVIWDNQRTMHRARPFRDREAVRDMHRTTVAGVGPTVVH